jgi:hypothetical protein
MKPDIGRSSAEGDGIAHKHRLLPYWWGNSPPVDGDVFSSPTVADSGRFAAIFASNH